MLKIGTVKEVREIVKLKQETIEEREFIYNRIFSSRDLGRWIVKKIGSDSQENFLLIGLNTRMQINVISTVFIGGITSANVQIAPIFQRLLLSNCTRFIIAHNHPGGSTEPSKADAGTTKRIKQAGEIMGINLLDHIIVNDRNYLSFAEEELL